MELFVPLLGILLAFAIYRMREESWREKGDNLSRVTDVATIPDREVHHTMKETFKESVMENIGTRDLFMQTLTNIGCQFELAEEEGDNRIFFAYQGEHFFADTTNEGWYVHVWDTHWGHVELYDIDEFTRLRKAINNANLNCATMTVYTIDEEGKNVDVHCKSSFPFIPQIPNLGNYLRGELNDFFRAHQYVGNEMAKLREKENATSYNG